MIIPILNNVSRDIPLHNRPMHPLPLWDCLFHDGFVSTLFGGMILCGTSTMYAHTTYSSTVNFVTKHVIISSRVCRTCQSDETCVLCHECFTNSNHEGHDVAFYHAQAGGCCDCGGEYHNM